MSSPARSGPPLARAPPPCRALAAPARPLFRASLARSRPTIDVTREAPLTGRANASGASGAAAGAAAVDAPAVDAPAEAAAASPFDWESQWYPVAFEAHLDASRPHQVHLLGRALALWRDGAGSWRAYEDRCPHRAAPLSEGKVVGDALQCSYHGWRFEGGDGACTKIPQAASAEAERAAAAAPRACATSFPVALAQGMIFVFGLGGAAGAEAAAAVSLPVDPVRAAAEAAGKKIHMFMPPYERALPYDHSTLVENVLDPSHVPFAHHGVQGNRDSVAFGNNAMEAAAGGASAAADGAPLLRVTRPPDFLGADNALLFAPPSRMAYVGRRKDGTYSSFALWAVPTAPGRSRLFAFMTTDRPLKFPFSLFTELPTWANHVFLRHPVLDGDNVFLHHQEHALAERDAAAAAAAGAAGAAGAAEKPAPPAWRQLFYTPTKADAMVTAFRRWLDGAGGGGPFGPLHAARGYGPLVADHRVLLDRFASHTSRCTACLRAMRRVGALRAAAGAGALVAAAAALALGLQAAAGAAAARAAAGCAAAALAGALAWRALDALYAQFNFVDYVHAER